MTTVDFAPLFRLYASRLPASRPASVKSSAAADQDAQSYPPYNIEKVGDDSYGLTMAVSGFRPEELDITVRGRHDLQSPAASLRTPRRPKSCIAGLPAARLSAGSCWPITSWSRVPT